MATLYYAHDPMCSWCYAFKPVLQQLEATLADRITMVSLLGGLAPDNDEPMAVEMQQRIQHTWQVIANKVSGTEFNFDFWQKTIPRRSTYPSCRAVLVARAIAPALEQRMITAIQYAYYRRALNPSDNPVLVQLAVELGMDGEQFQQKLQSSEIEQQLQQEIGLCADLGLDSFPSLLLQNSANSRWPVAIDYLDVSNMVDTIQQLLE